jgi:hypothetical protein
VLLDRHSAIFSAPALHNTVAGSFSKAMSDGEINLRCMWMGWWEGTLGK